MSLEEERKALLHVCLPNGMKWITHVVTMADGTKYYVCSECAEKIKRMLEQKQPEGRTHK
ncbi:MAG: hypothetical protein QXR42_05620 [Candidatus Bathyarchaeia archaeon]